MITDFADVVQQGGNIHEHRNNMNSIWKTINMMEAGGCAPTQRKLFEKKPKIFRCVEYGRDLNTGLSVPFDKKCEHSQRKEATGKPQQLSQLWYQPMIRRIFHAEAIKKEEAEFYNFSKKTSGKGWNTRFVALKNWKRWASGNPTICRGDSNGNCTNISRRDIWNDIEANYPAWMIFEETAPQHWSLGKVLHTCQASPTQNYNQSKTAHTSHTGWNRVQWPITQNLQPWLKCKTG